MTIPVEDKPQTKTQGIGLLEGTLVGELLIEAATSSQVLGLRVSVNRSDDVAAANRFGARDTDQFFVPPASIVTRDFSDAIYSLYAMGVQTGATNTTPTSGYKGSATFNETTFASIIDPDIMQRFSFDSGLNKRRVVITTSETWSSARYMLARIEVY